MRGNVQQRYNERFFPPMNICPWRGENREPAARVPLPGVCGDSTTVGAGVFPSKRPDPIRARNGPGFPDFPGPATRFCENAATRFPETAVFASVLIFTVVYPFFYHQVWPCWGGRSLWGAATSMGKGKKGGFGDPASIGERVFSVGK
jgi:hypothetical protein